MSDQRPASIYEMHRHPAYTGDMARNDALMYRLKLHLNRLYAKNHRVGLNLAALCADNEYPEPPEVA